MKKLLVMLTACVLALSCVSAGWAEEAAVSAGDRMTFGQYEQDNDPSNGPEPIEWTVLDVTDGKALLLSRFGLDAKPYHTENTEITWEGCSLRSWLNGEFLQTAFSAEEQARLVTVDTDNSESQRYGPWELDGGNNTRDRVVLLSYAEANHYLGVEWENHGNAKARCAPTAWAVAQGAFVTKSDQTTEDGDPAGWWWLRSPGGSADKACNVPTVGSLSDAVVTNEHGNVRPAIVISLDGNAAPADASATQPFTFRNGITWGMSPEEVAATEEGEPLSTKLDTGEILIYENSRVSKYPSQLGFYFISGKLVMSIYVPENPNEEMLNTLRKAYDTRYGEEAEADPAACHAVMDRVNPGYYTEEQVAAFPMYRWVAEGDTEIWMVFENPAAEGQIGILYVSPDMLTMQTEETMDLNGI